MKEKFEAPEMEMIEVKEDVLTKSPCGTGHGGGGGGGGGQCPAFNYPWRPFEEEE